MTVEERVDALRRIPLFCECSQDDLEAVARTADERAVPAGEALMRQGDAAQELVAIVAGVAAVERDGYALPRRRAGDFVGELALLTGRPRSATVTALTDVRVLVVERPQFERLLREAPSIANKLLIALAQRLPRDDV